MKLQILDITRNIFHDPRDLFNMTAHRGGRPFWLDYLKPYCDDIGVEVSVVSFEELDLSKPWFISLAPNSWNWTDFTDDLMTYLPENLSHELLNGNAYLLLNHECESFTNKFFKEIHKMLTRCKLKANKVLYMVGAADAVGVYEKFASENKISKEKRIKILISFHVFRRLDFDLYDFTYDNAVPKQKKFLSLNRTARIHRVMLVSLLAHYDLLDQGFISLGLEPNNIEHALSDLNRIPIYRDFRHIVYDGFEKIKPIIPMHIDQINLQENQFQVNSLSNDFYQKTYFSVVTSTFSLHNEEPSVGFTEKEIKPILFKHPFLINNLPGALKHLQSMGFLTFSKWFDESYDDEVDDFERMHKLVLEIKRLSSIPNEQWDQMLKEMEPILLHNYNILVKYNVEHIFFNSNLKDLLYYVN
jgi:hypothetical protein